MLDAPSLTRRKLVSMSSKRQADRGKLAAALNVELVLPQPCEDGDSSVIRQTHDRNGLLSQSFRNHAWGNIVARFPDGLVLGDY